MEPQPDALRIVRITLLGASDSGKTSLANAFVNGRCPLRPQPTDKAAIMYRKVEVEDEACVVEIEDTPGSERDDGGEFSCHGADAAPGILCPGVRVRIHDDKSFVEAAFRNRKLRYRREMDSMLGMSFVVRRINEEAGVCSLMLGGTSENVTVDFPREALEVSAAVVFPIDEFLVPGGQGDAATLLDSGRRDLSAKLSKPFSAYERPITSPGVERAVTRNRMGYFLCFDASDHTHESLKEAVSLHKMLAQTRPRWLKRKLQPIIALVACKTDRSSRDLEVRQILIAAQNFAESEDLTFYATSASTHRGVQEAFADMVSAISHRRPLWSLYGLVADDGDERSGDADKCALQ